MEMEKEQAIGLLCFWKCLATAHYRQKAAVVKAVTVPTCLEKEMTRLAACRRR